MKAIQTRYDGHFFRSRLEARWPVFFHTLAIPYSYEWEGFDLDGIRYLPDFWLPKQKSWFEVKGEEPTSQEMEKAARLAECTKKRVIIAYGDIHHPQDTTQRIGYFVYTLDMDGRAGGHADKCLQWCECMLCGAIGFTHYGLSIPAICSCSYEHPHLLHLILTPRWKTPRLLAAYSAAKEARF